MPPALNLHPRDFVGYGRRLVDPQWPGGARVAVEFAINYEAGGERTILDGDDRSEELLTDIGAPSVLGRRHLGVESSFEYGSRRGIWRLLRLFGERQIKVSVLAVASALQRNLEVAAAMVEAGHEIASHGWRWIDYAGMPEVEERLQIEQATSVLTELSGTRPMGCFTGRSSLNTRRLLVEAGYRYDQDAFNDELPYWVEVCGKPHLVIPYSLETNDNRFNDNNGFSTAKEFFQYMKDAFDLLYAEGRNEPKMMTIGLHDRLIGRPARAPGLARFLDYVQRFDDVWIARGIDIADHWHERHSSRP